MFVDIDTFAGALLQRSPAFALLTWKNTTALRAFIAHVGAALRKCKDDTIVVTLDTSTLDRLAFTQGLLQTLGGAMRIEYV